MNKGLEDKTFSDLTITQVSSGSFSGDVQIKDTSSNKILFLLDNTDVSLIEADDFIVTDFVWSLSSNLYVIDLVLPIQANAPRILQVDLLPTSALWSFQQSHQDHSYKNLHQITYL